MNSLVLLLGYFLATDKRTMTAACCDVNQVSGTAPAPQRTTCARARERVVAGAVLNFCRSVRVLEFWWTWRRLLPAHALRLLDTRNGEMMRNVLNLLQAAIS